MLCCFSTVVLLYTFVEPCVFVPSMSNHTGYTIRYSRFHAVLFQFITRGFGCVAVDWRFLFPLSVDNRSVLFRIQRYGDALSPENLELP
ncbi:hypothetical protein F4804DRAFT_255495 [Jackrogersella minutella]|nr:hypothetical protein F4804DRAFT_255495 [Jackrogersella minutella]